MSDWLTRFEGVLVTYGESLALPHRVRVAWAKCQYEAVLSGFSPYLQEKFPMAAEAINIANDFLDSGTYDLPYIDAFVRNPANGELAEAMQDDGYPLSLFQSVYMLLVCVASPFAEETGQTMEEATAGELEPLVARLGMTFATLQFWRQGITPFDSDIVDEYHDALQVPFYEFSRTGYHYARQLTAENVTKESFAPLQLDWTIRVPLPPELKALCPYKPPPQEWPR